MGKNTFYHSGSNGAAYTIIGQYELLPNASEWSCIDLYFTDEEGIYHNQTGIYDKENAETLDMTEDELWKLDDALSEKVLDFELTPFSSYAASESTNSNHTNHANAVSVYWADEILSTSSDYDVYSAYSGDDSVRVAFTTTESVKGFKILSLQYESIEDGGNLQFSTTELYDYGTMTADKTFVVEMLFAGAIPGYGISYVDAQGNTRQFSINTSGYDGSLLLQSFTKVE